MVGWSKGLTKETDIRVERMGESLKGRIPWNKGIPRSDEVRKKISKTKRIGFASGKIVKLIGDKNPMYGVKSWNKGLTKETDIRIMRYSIRFTGKKNPMYGKKHSLENRKKMSEALKGKIPWNKGGKLSSEHRKKISNAGKNRRHSLKTRKKMSDTRMGYVMPVISRKRLSESKKRLYASGKLVAWNKGMKMPESFCGENHPCWRGGITFLPYSHEFVKVIREQIVMRDNHTCFECNDIGDSVHHIDYRRDNNCYDNLVTLCRICHGKTGYNRDYWINRFQGMMKTLCS